MELFFSIRIRFLIYLIKERIEKNAKMKTVSIWSDVYDNIDLYRNSFYSGENSLRTLYPNFSLYKLRLWEEYFLKYNPSYVNSQKKKEKFSTNLKSKYVY
jgi:hypothetical protein